MKKNPEIFSNVIDEMMEPLFTKGLDKDKEFEADAISVVIGVSCVYHPHGLKRLIT